MKTIDDIILLCDSRYGVYIPQIIIENNINNNLWDFSECQKEDIECVLRGPDENEWYFHAWANIMNQVKIVDEDGTEFFITYNEDLWLVPCDIDFDELEEWTI